MIIVVKLTDLPSLSRAKQKVIKHIAQDREVQSENNRWVSAAILTRHGTKKGAYNRIKKERIRYICPGVLGPFSKSLQIVET